MDYGVAADKCESMCECTCTPCVRLSFDRVPKGCGSSYYALADAGGRNTGG